MVSQLFDSVLIRFSFRWNFSKFFALSDCEMPHPDRLMKFLRLSEHSTGFGGEELREPMLQ